MRLLLVEDDPLLGRGLEQALAREGYTVDWLRDGQQALQALATEDFSAVILDLGLPGLDGLEVLKAAREQKVTTPVLILTARDTLADRVDGLDLGADDYLSKPFAMEELFARVRAIVRRAMGRSSARITHGALTLDPNTREVTFHGQSVSLSPREFALLLYLMEHRGRPASRERLESQLYGWTQEIESNAIEVHIHKLRKKLGRDLIVTVRGVGYMVPR